MKPITQRQFERISLLLRKCRDGKRAIAECGVTAGIVSAIARGDKVRVIAPDESPFLPGGIRPLFAAPTTPNRARLPENMTPRYMPTLEQVLQECQAIQADWSKRERRKRQVGRPPRVMVPMANCHIDIWTD
jgi:hypothetical protein